MVLPQGRSNHSATGRYLFSFQVQSRSAFPPLCRVRHSLTLTRGLKRFLTNPSNTDRWFLLGRPPRTTLQMGFSPLVRYCSFSALFHQYTRYLGSVQQPQLSAFFSARLHWLAY